LLGYVLKARPGGGVRAAVRTDCEGWHVYSLSRNIVALGGVEGCDGDHRGM